MQIDVLPITGNIGDREAVLHPVLLSGNGEMVLVDCGYPGSLPLLQEAAAKRGLCFNQLTGLLLTHHDIDHMGAAYELLQAHPQVKVYAPAGEAPYISGNNKLLQLQQAEDLYPCLPAEYKPGALAFQLALQALKPVPVDVVLDENDQPFGKDVQLVSTPGHTPGHLSLYLKKEQVVVAADAVVIENDVLGIANPQFTHDLPQAVASVQKLSRLPVRKLICYHGGMVEKEIEKKFHMLLQAYKEQ